MNIRSKLNNNPAVATTAAGGLLVVCVGLLVYQVFGGGTGQESGYFLDTNANEVFIADHTTDPIEAPSGSMDNGDPAGFRARIYTCGECGDYAGMNLKEVKAANATVAFIVRSPPSSGDEPANPTLGNLLSEPHPIQWVGPGPEVAKVAMPNLPCENPEPCEP